MRYFNEIPNILPLPKKSDKKTHPTDDRLRASIQKFWKTCLLHRKLFDVIEVPIKVSA
jgi:hypothetical protein